ncbi:GntR family transcriptional regulator [Variovorax rhizosphaerae]|uniref:GntR family transcriptional regulator n=1 Tax=Variovorax rhizosphaerae TaxID=1836200 RepID=A0ABU8WMS7_9BURK
MTVDRSTAVSLYQQIADQLKADIARGAFADTGMVPPERDLMTRFGVSRVTVRQAMTQLLREERVVRKQGKGTFVSSGPTLKHELHSMRGFYDSLLQQGIHPKTRLLSFAPAGADDASGFALQRLYEVDEAPIALVSAWLPPEAARITWQQAAEHPIYGILETLLQLKVTRTSVRIRVLPADAQVRKALGLAGKSFVLTMDRESFAEDGRTLERTTFFIRPERYEFVLNTVGPLPISSSIRDSDSDSARS